ERSDCVFPEFLSSVGVKSEEVSAVVDKVKPVAVDNRRRVAATDPGYRPLNVTLAKRSLPCGIDRCDQTHLVGVEILLAVRSEDCGAVDHCAVVDTALGNRATPHRLSRQGLHRVDRAIGSADYYQTDAVNRRGDRSWINSVIRAAPRRTGPHTFASLLVEGKEAMFTLRSVAPAIDDRAYNYQIAFDDWRSGAPAVSCPRAEFLSQRAAPKNLAVIRQRSQLIAGAEHIDIPGCWIAYRRSPGAAA